MQINDDNAIAKIKEFLAIAADDVAKLQTDAGFPYIASLLAERYPKGRTYFTGIGKCSYIAMKHAASLKSIQCDAEYLDATTAMHGDLGTIPDNDTTTLIAISKSGLSSELYILFDSLLKLKPNIKVYLLCLSTDAQLREIATRLSAVSTLSSYVNIVRLKVETQEVDKHGIIPTISNTIFDVALSAVLAPYSGMPELLQRLKAAHPGGTLQNKVTNILNNLSNYKQTPTNLMIVAAGNATRNFAYTLNGALPKVLLSVGKQTMLESIINSYNTMHIDNIVIVCQSKHKVAIDELMAIRMPDVVYTIVINDKANGTSNTVLQALEQFDMADWYINWSDVYGSVPKVTEDTLFTDGSALRHGHMADYVYAKSKSEQRTVHIKKSTDATGNVAGIFYVTKATVKALQTPSLTIDQSSDMSYFDMLLNDYAKLSLHDINDIVDIGDMTKYHNTMVNTTRNALGRYFNKLEMHDDYVLKSPRTEYGEKLHEIEVAYYKAYSAGTAFAKLLSYDEASKTMKLERVQGMTCQEYFNAKPTVSNAKWLYENFKIAIATIHTRDVFDTSKLPGFDEANRAIYNEFVTAISKRVDPFLKTITDYKAMNRIATYHGQAMLSYLNVRKQIGDCIHLWSGEPDIFEFCLTHGDPNTDNTIISDKGDIRFIDPRGFFGNLDILGLGVLEYDHAKFLYGLTGYSAFNAAPYIRTEVVDGDLRVYLGDNKKPGISPVSVFDVTDDVVLQVLVGIIWMKLCTYIINDPAKAVIAYMHGNAIVTKALSLT